MLNVQLRGLFSLKKLLIINFSLLIFTSCSVQQKISKSAKQVINDTSLLTAHVGISIYEPESGKYWYNYQGDKYFVPASNTKIPTCYAAMKYLGDSLIGLRYRIFSDSVVKIQSTGDPTFLHTDFLYQPGYTFLKKYKYIIFSGELFNEDFLGSGWTWNDYKNAYSAQRSDFPIYGNTVKFKWEDKNSISAKPEVFMKSVAIMEDLTTGFDIIKPWEDNKFLFLKGSEKSKEIPFRPDILSINSLLQDTLGSYVTTSFDKPGYAQSTEVTFFAQGKTIKIPNQPATKNEKLYRLNSQPTDSLLKPLMHRSDNFFAEQSLLMVSNERLGIMSDEKIIDTLLKTDLKDLPQKPRWADGSGLSRYNLFTPQDFVAILNKMKNEFGMERIKVIFPTGGTGTISNYYKADSTFIFAKTGTLSGVVALSGFLYTKKGKLLIFSTLVNNHQASSTAVRRAVEKFIQGIREKY